MKRYKPTGRPRGRPALDPDFARSVNLTLRISPATMRALGSRPSTAARVVIETAFASGQLPPKTDSDS